MDAIVEHESILPEILSGMDEPIDILGRHEVVAQLVELLITLSDAKSSCTFALNGKWGSGKTFVLKMVERQLRDYQAGEKFTVFHYNCWKYDYYDEPLIAIVSSMLDSIDEYTQFFSGEVREKIQAGIMNTAKQIIKRIACSFVENKIGIDAKDLLDDITDIRDASDKDAKEPHKYDKYYAFHKTIEKAREELSTLAENQTLVIVVDELDRCLPEYAIKVLERLHHLFSEIDNVTVVFAIDLTQLDNTIAQIFGEKIDASAYLKKFINFEIPLSLGTVNSSFSLKYNDYFSLFSKAPSDICLSIEDYFSALFSGIPIRAQEQLMDRIKMVHNLLFSEETLDYSFMCLELMILVFHQYDPPIKSMPFRIRYSDHGSYDLYFSSEVPNQIRQYLQENWHIQSITHLLPKDSFRFNSPIAIPQLVVWYSQELYGFATETYQLPTDIQDRFNESGYIEKLKHVKQLLDTIQ